MINISTLYFPELERIAPLKGEDRLKFFKRQFKSMFSTLERKQIHKFIQDYGYQPLFPNWPKRGCYPISAFRYFIDHPNRDKIVSALLVGDLLQNYPKLEFQLLEEMVLTTELQKLEQFAVEENLKKALEFLQEKIYLERKENK